MLNTEPAREADRAQTPEMSSASISLETAQAIELAEINAWLDLYQAAPPEFTKKYKLRWEKTDGAVLFAARALRNVRFNRVLGLGLLEPATEESLSNIVRFYQQEQVHSFMVHVVPQSLPVHLTEWFEYSNFQPHGGWDRVYLDASHADYLEGPAADVEKVEKNTAEEWAGFIDRAYGLRNTPWLLALVERQGWHHYAVRDSSGIVASRSMYIGYDGAAWLGVETPIPGVMTSSFGSDCALCRTMVRNGTNLGARFFVAEIEAPSVYFDTPAYHDFSALGFTRPYFRSNWIYEE